MVSMFFLHQVKQFVPVFIGNAFHKTVFIGKAPPDVAVSGIACHHVTGKTFIYFLPHHIKTPFAFIVWAEKDHIGFNTEALQLLYTFIDVLKIRGVETREVPVISTGSFKWENGDPERIVYIPVFIWWNG